MEKYSIICPCCEANLTIDAVTGALISHEEKKKATGSFEELAGELNKQKELREQLFAQEMSSMPRSLPGTISFPTLFRNRSSTTTAKIIDSLKRSIAF